MCDISICSVPNKWSHNFFSQKIISIERRFENVEKQIILRISVTIARYVNLLPWLLPSNGLWKQCMRLECALLEFWPILEQSLASTHLHCGIFLVRILASKMDQVQKFIELASKNFDSFSVSKIEIWDAFFQSFFSISNCS